MQVLSEPDLRRDFLGQHEAAPHKETIRPYRSGLADLMGTLDVQCAVRREEKRQLDIQLKAQERVRQEVRQRALDEATSGERPAWTYTDAPGYFEPPKIDTSASFNHTKNRSVQGIYDCPSWRAPHVETGGWEPATKNENAGLYGEFGPKPKHQLSPTENKFAAKLDKTLAKTRSLEARDAFLGSSGSFKRQVIEATADEHSCLKKTKQAWNAQLVSTHEHFSNPDATKPGDYLHLDVIKPYVTNADRAMSYERDIVVGKPYRTNHWHQPKGQLTGTAHRHAAALELLTPSGVRKVRLKEEREVRMAATRTMAGRSKSATSVGTGQNRSNSLRSVRA